MATEQEVDLWWENVRGTIEYDLDRDEYKVIVRHGELQARYIVSPEFLHVSRTDPLTRNLFRFQVYQDFQSKSLIDD